MKLEALSDQSLIAETDRLAREERLLLTELLHHLREMDRRRLFVTLGYGSLFAYGVGRLGYTEDEAYRRISAMRILKELPEVETKIASCVLSLTNISMAKVTFRRIDAIREQKLEILGRLENKSKREAERVLAEYCPRVRPDSIRAATSDLVEFRFSGPRSILEKVEELKGLLAHKFPEATLGQLFDFLCDFAINALRPVPERDRPRQSKAETRRKVWARAGHKCERCGSRHALQIDHILPKAKGGTDDECNLRLLCRACNQRAAIEELGQEKMDPYLN